MPHRKKRRRNPPPPKSHPRPRTPPGKGMAHTLSIQSRYTIYSTSPTLAHPRSRVRRNPAPTHNLNFVPPQLLSHLTPAPIGYRRRRRRSRTASAVLPFAIVSLPLSLSLCSLPSLPHQDLSSTSIGQQHRKQPPFPYSQTCCPFAFPPSRFPSPNCFGRVARFAHSYNIQGDTLLGEAHL